MSKIQEKQKKLAQFEKSLKNKTLEELQAMEQELIKKADKNGEDLGKLEFDMPDGDYETVAQAVRYFLDKESVQWQYTLGLVSMYDFWDPKKKPAKIPYPHLDSILHTLGNGQYKGYKEWSMVVAINKYFEPLSKAYTEATDEAYNIAMEHDAVMKAMELLVPIKKEDAK